MGTQRIKQMTYGGIKVFIETRISDLDLKGCVQSTYMGHSFIIIIMI